MTETMQAIDLKNLDKSNWKTYRFDEIAKNISERVDPNNTDLEVYIGLEHIDSDSIHIKRTGTPDDVNGQKLRCYPGDVIFGRRRAYQRKAAISTVDGFCSAHSLVLRANPVVIEPKLFPFFLHSDLFMHRAVDISVGSLSPTINWGTLKHQEFLLPPKHQQVQLAELLWAMNAVIEKELVALERTKIFYESTVYQEFYSEVDFDMALKGKIKTHGHFNFVELNKTSKLITDGTHKTPDYVDSGVPFLSTVNLIPFGKEFDFSSYQKFITHQEHLTLSKRCMPEKGDLLISKCGTIGRCQVIRADLEFSIFVGLALVKPNTQYVTADYLEIILNTDIYQRRMKLLAPGGTRSTLAIAPLKGLIIPLPNIDTQKKLTSKFKRILSICNSVNLKVESSKVLQKNLINQIF